MNVVGLVPSRLNSERLPAKNVKDLGGTPLINYTVRLLNKVHSIKETVVFASDRGTCDYIESNLHYTFLERPTTLDTQTTTIQDIIREFLRLRADVDIVVLLHITSPFLKPLTIQDCVEKVTSGQHDSSLTTNEIRKFCWFKGKPLNYSLEGSTPRTQDIEPVYVEQSSLYVFSREFFQATGRRIGNRPYMKSIDHFEGHDIDTPEDFEIAELIVNSGFFGHLK